MTRLEACFFTKRLGFHYGVLRNVNSMLRSLATKPFLSDFGILILRVITGTLLIHHGYEKLANIENFADAFVRPLHLPFPIRWVNVAIGTIPQKW